MKLVTKHVPLKIVILQHSHILGNGDETAINTHVRISKDTIAVKQLKDTIA